MFVSCSLYLYLSLMNRSSSLFSILQNRSIVCFGYKSSNRISQFGFLSFSELPASPSKKTANEFRSNVFFFIYSYNVFEMRYRNKFLYNFVVFSCSFFFIQKVSSKQWKWQDFIRFWKNCINFSSIYFLKLSVFR